ncbi:MAG TPA: extracellular solute-binding protein [Acidobacteriota bacterium]|nr:extracellular solute-binding protein [Acidobacteriota bacterium]
MSGFTASLNWFGLSFVIYVLASLLSLPPLLAASAPVSDEAMDQVYEKAKKEGGKVTVYAPFSNRSIEVILPGFMKRFPGVTVNHVDGTPNQLLARVIAEARGGRVLADVFGGSLPYMAQITEQKLVAPLTVPEAAAFPAQMKSSFWVATDTQYYVLGWNTNLLKKGEAPNNFEDLANAKWKNNLMAEDRDYQMLIALAKRKYNNDDKAIELFKKIAANQVEFHRGHSDLVEFLVAGQQAVCFTCYAHHFPPRVKKGAPIQSLLNEGVGEIGGAVSMLKDAPHPIGALLWTRWALSEEGQRVWAQAGETPAHPHVEPLEKVRPVTTYMLNIDDLKEFPKYEKIWKEIFQIR